MGPGTLKRGDAELMPIGGGLRNGDVDDTTDFAVLLLLPEDVGRGFLRVGKGGGNGKLAFLGIGKCNLRTGGRILVEVGLLLLGGGNVI